MNFGSDWYKEMCADHQAICDVAALQPFVGEEFGSLLYLAVEISDGPTEPGFNRLNFVINKSVVSKENAIYDKDEVLTALKAEMENTFPEYIIETSDYDVTKHEDVIYIQEQRVANKVAQHTRRGAANTKFLDFLYYKSNSGGAHSAIDAPFIVYKFGDKYGIFKHPKADQYGFRLIYK